MDELTEYHQRLMSDIRREADSSGVLMVEAFFDRVIDRLTEAGELETADRAFYQSGEGAQRIRVDGYAGDPRDNDGVLGLIVCDFADSEEAASFGKSELASLLNPLIRFLKKAKDHVFRDGLSEVSAGFQLSDLIISSWSHITKIKLILISNRIYKGRDDSVKLADAGGVPITYSVWDLARFQRYDRSGLAREEMVVDFDAEFGGPVPALKASQTGAALESYVMIIPGHQLAEVYDRWGARLLEANVRSFLQARAKTNRGIQSTIKERPELFFPFNNGLSATADSVDCVQTKDGLVVTRISNLQIVNGAQTTGTVHSALRTMSDKLSHVFVQMKLTLVPSSMADEIVPLISEFANTQNKVNAADFFSNHPFHVRIEQFSRDVIFAPKPGERHDSKWFYERSRGQYANARLKLTSAQQKKFDLEFPKSQLFSKTDLSKFASSAAGEPHIVSRGAQKNFAAFSKEIGLNWAKDDSKYDELWFKRLIAIAIIFRHLEMHVPKQAWYEGGYRANIVTYAVAKIFHDSSQGKQTLDVDAVWRRQTVSDPLAKALLRAAAAAHDAITHPPRGVRNMSEWAKQQACWGSIKACKLEYDDDFDSCLVLVEIANGAARDARSAKSAKDGIDALSQVVTLGDGLWRDVLKWGLKSKRITPKEVQILEICASVPRRFPTDSQSKTALGVLERMRADDVAS